MFNIIPFSDEHQNSWNDFVGAEGHLFFFHRDYMSYHQDRFEDFSLLIFEAGKLKALLPANRRGTVFFSHEGLTFGDFLFKKGENFFKKKIIISLAIEFLKKIGFTECFFRAQARFLTGNEDFWALYSSAGARLVKCNTNVILPVLGERKKGFSEQKIRNLRRFPSSNVEILSNGNLPEFWAILREVLTEKYGKNPVHSLAEMEFLTRLFPHNIRLYTLVHEGKTTAGALVFDYFSDNSFLHFQYFAANEKAKKHFFLDALCTFLIENNPESMFSFGISDGESGLNENLLRWKMQFGGETAAMPVFHLLLSRI